MGEVLRRAPVGHPGHALRIPAKEDNVERKPGTLLGKETEKLALDHPKDEFRKPILDAAETVVEVAKLYDIQKVTSRRS
jgi:hypothetical protein